MEHILERLNLNKQSKNYEPLENFIQKYNLTIDTQKSDKEYKVYIVPFKEKIFDVIKKQTK